MIEKSYLAAAAFFGATVGLLAAKMLFGATGVETAESIAYVGFVLTMAAHVALGWKREGHAHG